MSCKNNKQTTAKAVADSTVYYPINNYIREQVQQIDTTPYNMYRVLIINGKKDSAAINHVAFDSLIKQFILPELEEAALRENFKEAVYADQSTSSITLTYTPKDSNTSIQNAMVLLDTASQYVKWIFINTLENKGDSTIIQKIGWKSGANCYLNRSVAHADGKVNETQLTIVWNENKE